MESEAKITNLKEIVPSSLKFAVDDNFEDDRFMKVRISLMHSGTNRKKSSFDKEVIEEALERFANIPILAHVIIREGEDGEEILDFAGHDMHLEEDKFSDGNYHLVYDEIPVGVIPESNNIELVYEEDEDLYRVYADGYLYKQYGNYVCDIIEARGGNTDVSMEIDVLKGYYSIEKDVLIVQKMQPLGVTLLGEDRTPGMEGASAQTYEADSSTKDERFYKLIQELKDTLDLHIQLYTEANSVGKEVAGKMEKNEVLESVEEVKDEILEEVEDAPDVTEEVVEAEESTVEDTEEPEENFEEETLVEPIQEEPEAPVEISLSHDEIRTKINKLLHENDEDEYRWLVTVFDNRFIYEKGYMEYYAQEYTIVDGEIVLVEEPFEVFGEFVTKEERAEITKMRENYDALLAKISAYELKEETEMKTEVLNSKTYSPIFEADEYKSIKENFENYSLDELTSALDGALLDFYKNKGAEMFECVSEEDHKAKNKMFGVSEKIKKKSRYGNLFSRN